MERIKEKCSFCGRSKKETAILDIEEDDEDDDENEFEENEHEVYRKPKTVYAAKNIVSSSVVTEPVVTTKRSTRGRNI